MCTAILTDLTQLQCIVASWQSASTLQLTFVICKELEMACKCMNKYCAKQCNIACTPVQYNMHNGAIQHVNQCNTARTQVQYNIYNSAIQHLQ